MRTLAKNKQKMYYATATGIEIQYERNPNGTLKYIEVDGKPTPIPTGGKTTAYSSPVKFFGSITMSGGEIIATEYGLDNADYNAVLIVSKDALPIDEKSLIWYDTEPEIYPNNGNANGYTADYKVVKCSKSLNVDKYLLQKIVKKNE